MVHQKEMTSIDIYGKKHLHLLIIAAITIAAYSNSFNVPFQFDDIYNIAENPYIKNSAYFVDILNYDNYGLLFKTRYIGFLSFALNYAAHGLRPFGFHMVNTFIHIANAFLLYFLVILILRSPALKESKIREHAPLIAFLSALVFALHPIQTQAVTYIIQRLASMATMFYLASVLCYIQFRIGGQRPWYIAAMISAVLGMFTKEVTITLPIMLVFVEAVFFDGELKRRGLRLLPFMLMLFIIPSVMLYVSTGGDLSLALEDAIKSTKLQTEMSRTEYLYTQFGVLLKYIRLMLLPYGQTLDHYHPVENLFMSAGVLLPLIGHMLIVGTAGYMYIKCIQGRLDPAFKVVAFGVAWFYIASSVESGLIPIKDVIYEHRVYLPGTGLIVSAVILATMGLIRFRSEKIADWLVVLCLAATIVYLPLTVIRNRVWQSTISLWTDAVSKSPQNPRARINLGGELQNAGLHEKAIEQFNIAIKLDPSLPNPYTGLSKSYSALGEEGLASKYSEIAKAMAFEPVDYYLERGWRFLDNGMYDQALQEFLSAYEYSPDNMAVLLNLGLFYSRKGMNDKALPYLTRARLLNPDNVETYGLLAEIYQRIGKPDLARETYISGLDIEPLNSTLHGKFGNFLGQAAEYDLALKHLAKAIELAPDNIEAHLGLGNVMFATGNLEAAISSFNKMLDLKPDNSQAHYNLSVIYAKLGRQEESMKHMNTYQTLTDP